MGKTGDSGRRSTKYSDMDVMRAVDSIDGDVASAEEVAEELGCHKTTATRRLESLQDRGLVSGSSQSIKWEVDIEPQTILAPLNQVETMGGAKGNIKLREDIDVRREGVPESFVPNELAGYETVRACLFPEEEQEIFDSIEYGDYILFYTEYNEPVEFSGCEAEVVVSARIVDKIDKPEVSDYLFHTIEPGEKYTLILEDVTGTSHPHPVTNPYVDYEEYLRLMPDITMGEVGEFVRLKKTEGDGLVHQGEVEEPYLRNLPQWEDVRLNMVRSDFCAEFGGDINEWDEKMKPEIISKKMDVEYMEYVEGKIDSIGYKSSTPDMVDIVKSENDTTWLIKTVGWMEIGLGQYEVLKAAEKLYSEVYSRDVKKGLATGAPLTRSNEKDIEFVQEYLSGLDTELFIHGRDFDIDGRWFVKSTAQTNIQIDDTE